MHKRVHLKSAHSYDLASACKSAERTGDPALAFTRLLDALPLAFFLLDARHNITRVSQQAAALWQRKPAELQGLPLAEFFSRVGLPEYQALTTRLLRQRQPDKITFFAPRQQKWLEISAGRAPGGGWLCFSDVTALKTAEAGLQARQQVIDAAPDLYLILSESLRVEMVSDALLAAFHTRRELLVGQYVDDWLAAVAGQQNEKAIRNLLVSLEKVLQTQQPDHMPVQHYDLPGEDGQPRRRYWSPLNTPVLDAQGQVRFIIHKINDITELVSSRQEARGLAEQNIHLNHLVEHALRMEVAARAAQRHLEEAQQIGHIGSFEWSRGSEAAYCSDELYRIFGLPPQSTGMTLPRVLQYVHAEDRNWLEQEVARLRQQPQATRLSYRIIRPDGATRYLNCQFESFADARGQVHAIRGTVQDFTDQKRTDLILDTINEVCFELDTQFNFTYVNPKALRTWQKTAAQILGCNYWEVFPEIAGTAIAAALTRAATTRRQVVLESYCPVTDTWVFLNANPSPAGLIVLNFDLTEQVKARQRLAEQQEQYRALVENIPDVVTRWNRSLELVYANSAFAAPATVPAGRFVAHLRQQMRQPGDPARPWMEKLQQVFETGRPQSYYEAFPIPAGTGYCCSQLVPERAADGLVQTVLAITRDISDLKAAEARIMAGKTLLQTVLDASTNGIFLAQAVRNARQEIVDFEIRLTNQAFNQLLGQDVTGKRMREHWPSDRASSIFHKLKQVVETGTMIEEELLDDRDNLNHWFYIIAMKTENGIVVTVRDISYRKRQEEIIARHLSILQQSEELVHMGSWEYEVTGQAFVWSEGMYRLFDLPPGSPVHPEIYREYAVPADRVIADRIVRSMQQAQPFDETLRIRLGHSRKILRVKGIVIAAGEHQPPRMLGVDLDITEMQRLEQENLRMKLQQQKTLMLAILEAQESERKRIAEGLHNGVAQLLYAAKLNLDQIPAAPLDPAQLQNYKQHIDQLLLEAISETRRISHELMPRILEDLGLEAAIQDIGRKFSSESLDLECRVYRMPRTLEKHLQLAIYRIAQELANNIVKHAGATKASIQVRQKDRHMALLAEDNGLGFTLPPDQAQGMGLRSIRDRVNLLNGTMEIDSQPHRGTLISIFLPLAPGT